MLVFALRGRVIVAIIHPKLFYSLYTQLSKIADVFKVLAKLAKIIALLF